MLLVLTGASGQPKKILIVSTNRDSVGSEASGTYLKEIAHPYRHFIQSGFDVDILTPKGGKASVYGTVTDDLKDIANDTGFLRKVESTLSPMQVRSRDYAAVYFPGGHGQYFDVVNDERIAKITADIYERNGILGTAGHGVASLINIQLKNGTYLVKGKKMTCFPTWAEKAWMKISGYGKFLQFDVQEVLIRRGANLIVCTENSYQEKSLTMIIDHPNRMITGAFAFNAQWVAEEMVRMIRQKKRVFP